MSVPLYFVFNDAARAAWPHTGIFKVTTAHPVKFTVMRRL